MSTAEYAVGTLAAACIGCVILKLSDDPAWLTDLFARLEQWVLQIMIGFDRPWI